jgi:phosphoserine phosphatase
VTSAGCRGRTWTVNLERSLAFGDTAQDAAVFRLVGLPIAVNPDDALHALCGAEGWRFYNEANLTQLDDIIDWI